MIYQENPNRKVICVDFDHVLTSDPKGEYSDDPPPEMTMVCKITRAYRNGNIIIIWTARQWNNAPFLVSWLTKYSVPYHGIKMEKGGACQYVDDKMVSIDEFLKGEDR